MGFWEYDDGFSVSQNGNNFFDRVCNCPLLRMYNAPFILTVMEKKLKSVYLIKHGTVKAQREVSLQLNEFLTSYLGEDKWSASRFTCFKPIEITSNIGKTGGFFGSVTLRPYAIHGALILEVCISHMQTSRTR
jgi:hypothetical protein